MDFEHTPRRAALDRQSAEKTLVLALASSAGVHGALILATLLAAYVATRFVATAPLTHPEPIDLLGVATKLIEAGGLVLALRLLGTRAGGAATPPALYEGAAR